MLRLCQISELLSMSQCASDAYQYINSIIENALKQTEQILLRLKTRRDDTIINVKNKTGFPFLNI